jgi:hypothetical protein
MKRFPHTALALLALGAASSVNSASINGINGGMPNRISMNVTVPKQTQGATFGEKVKSGLQSAGSAVASGVRLTIECGTAACIVALPDGSGYRAALDTMALAPLDAAQGLATRKGAAGVATLVGGALPGGSILSAAVSSVSSLAGGGSGAAAASYAATGRSAPRPPLASRTQSDGNIDVTEPLVAGDYTLTLVVQKTAATRVRMRLVFSAADGALRAQPASSENSIAPAT